MMAVWRVYSALSSSIARRRCAKHATVLPVELGGAFVAHQKSGIGDIHPLCQHQTPGLLQPQLLLMQRSQRKNRKIQQTA